MAYKITRAEAVDRDLELIFDFLYEAALGFYEDAATAFDRAATRIRAIEDAIAALGRVPHQGTLRPDLAEGLRSVTKDRAILYFEVDDTAQLVRVFAVFFGGQDHQRHMLLRLLGSPTPQAPA